MVRISFSHYIHPVTDIPVAYFPYSTCMSLYKNSILFHLSALLNPLNYIQSNKCNLTEAFLKLFRLSLTSLFLIQNFISWFAALCSWDLQEIERCQCFIHFSIVTTILMDKGALAGACVWKKRWDLTFSFSLSHTSHSLVKWKLFKFSILGQILDFCGREQSSVSQFLKKAFSFIFWAHFMCLP